MVDHPETHIPARFRAMGLDDYDTKLGDPGVHKAVEQYLDNLEVNARKGKGVLFVGPPGTGKTMLASIIGVAARYEGHTVDYIKFTTYMNLIGQKMELQPLLGKDDEGERLWWQADSRIRAVKNQMKFLILDDVGKEYESTWTEMQFDHLLRLRYDLALPTILTTNIAIPNWGGQYNLSMRSFVEEACVLIQTGGHDVRRESDGS